MRPLRAAVLVCLIHSTTSLAVSAPFCGRLIDVRGWQGVSSLTLAAPDAANQPSTAFDDKYASLADPVAIRAVETLTGLDLSDFLLEERVRTNGPAVASERLFVCVDGFTSAEQSHYGTTYRYLYNASAIRVWKSGEPIGAVTLTP